MRRSSRRPELTCISGRDRRGTAISLDGRRRIRASGTCSGEMKKGDGMAASGRILTKDLDARLSAVEQKIAAMADYVTRLAEQLQQGWQPQPVPAAQTAERTNQGNGYAREEPADEGRIAELEAQLSRLGERIEKIAQTVVTQRWS